MHTQNDNHCRNELHPGQTHAQQGFRSQNNTRVAIKADVSQRQCEHITLNSICLRETSQSRHSLLPGLFFQGIHNYPPSQPGAMVHGSI